MDRMGDAERRYFEERQGLLRESLRDKGIDAQLIDDVIDSGYFYTNIRSHFSRDSVPGVKDSYYGNKPAGL